VSQAASRLSDLTSLITKGTTPSTLGLNFADAGVPFLRAQNLRDGRVDVDADPLFIPPETHKALARSRIVAGDILLSIAGTIGRAALVDDRWPELNCNQAVAIIRPTEKVDPKYLLHWLNSQGAVGQITKSEVTATISNLSLTQIGNLVVALPSLSEQRRIAAILDQADDLRRKRRESLELLEGLARVIFLEMFGDPVTNSRGWVICSFGEAGTLDRGVSKHRPRNDPTLLGGPYPLIQTGDIANCDGYVRSYNATYSEQGLKQSKLWPKGTLCITIAANIGNTGILAFDACFPDSVVGFTPNSAVRT